MIKVKSFSRKEIIYEAIGRTISVFSAISLTYTLMIWQYRNNKPGDRYECKNTQKEFQGKVFNIQICEGSFYSGDYYHRPVRVSVFDEQGSLRAVRHFVSRDLSRFGDPPIGYQGNRLMYFYLDTDITMPPTALDWLRARIPFTDIGQFEQMWYY